MTSNTSPGTRRAVAAALGINAKYVYQCLSGRRDMSPELAARVERESGGALLRKHLNRRWREIWPELISQEETHHE